MWAGIGIQCRSDAQIIDRSCEVSLAIALHAALEARGCFVGHASQPQRLVAGWFNRASCSSEGPDAIAGSDCRSGGGSAMRPAVTAAGQSTFRERPGVSDWPHP